VALGNNGFGTVPFLLFPYCYSLLYRIQSSHFGGDSFGVSNVFMAVISDEHGLLPPLLPHQRWETLFHGLELRGVPASALQYTLLGYLGSQNLGVT
jgi:hypothetical protein